jgi:hypothetical protein
MSATRPINELPPANVAGLTIAQRKCLVAAERSNGLAINPARCAFRKPPCWR